VLTEDKNFPDTFSMRRRRRRRYLFDSNKQQSWQFNANSNRAGLPENPKVNNAGHPYNTEAANIHVYTKKTNKQKTHKYAPVAIIQTKTKVQKVHNVYSNVDELYKMG